MEQLIKYLYIELFLPRAKVAKRLGLSVNQFKRRLKKLKIKRKGFKECIECKSSPIVARARCGKCYKKQPDQRQKTREYISQPETKQRLSLWRKNRYLTSPLIREKQYKYKQTPKYKAYMQKYNEWYRQTKGYLKRPAIYWQNRWAKIQETQGCNICHTMENLEAHHIISIKEAQKLGWDKEQTHNKSNLIILCRLHHRGHNQSKINHNKVYKLRGSTI